MGMESEVESLQLHLAYAKIRETIPAMAQRMDDLRNTRSGGGGGSSGGSTDYMAQMIQFSTMEQLKDLTESMNTTMLMTQQQQALAMIGKTVTVTGEASIVTGVVDKVKFSNGFATLMIGGKDYYLNDVQSIGE